MLDLLLAVEHLPAFDTQNLPVRFGLDNAESVDEGEPLV